jgi:hypothetical protein
MEDMKILAVVPSERVEEIDLHPPVGGKDGKNSHGLTFTKRGC